MSLLLLRAVIGVAIVVQGGSILGAPDATAASWIVGLSAVASGCMMLAGFLTPLAGIIVGLDVLGIAVSVLPVPASVVFDSRPAVIFGLTILLAIIGAGPGRFSVDARMFGRREIIIPLPHHS
ncbi:MAG: hypothetical protein C5B51_08980 [Terriglobia bacterium]|nr:MAG: hypothetical protein C5B51_08980 [Terriglobia bacterium]